MPTFGQNFRVEAIGLSETAQCTNLPDSLSFPTLHIFHFSFIKFQHTHSTPRELHVLREVIANSQGLCWVVLIQPRVRFEIRVDPPIPPFRAPKQILPDLTLTSSIVTREDKRLEYSNFQDRPFFLQTSINRARELETKHVLSASFRSTPGYLSHIRHVVHIIAQRSLGTPSNGSGLTFWRYLATIHSCVGLRRFRAVLNILRVF